MRTERRHQRLFPVLLMFALLLTPPAPALEQQAENFTVLATMGAEDFKALEVHGNRAYIVQGNDLLAVDVTDPAVPHFLSIRRLEGNGTVERMMANDTHLFLQMRWTTTDTLHVYGYSNPYAPAYLGIFGPYETSPPTTLELEGNRLYLGYPSQFQTCAM